MDLRWTANVGTPVVVVVVIEAVREWRSEMIWRQRDLEPAGAEAAAAEMEARKAV